MDSYQAIYDGVRSRISGVGDAVERAARDAFDMGNMRDILTQEFCIAAHEMARPSVVFKPTLSIDGDMYYFLLGENLMEGIAGFGKTVSEAATAFDTAFYNEKTPKAIRLARKDEIMAGFDNAIEAIKAS